MMNTPCAGLIVPPAAGLVPRDGAILYGDRVKFIARGLGKDMETEGVRQLVAI